jgi:ankyrin repeat protein
LLIAAGADLNATCQSGDTPLHSALRADRLGLVKLLLEAGADPNQLYQNAVPPLGLCGTPQAVELLLAAGANVSGSEADVAMAALRQTAHGNDAVFAVVLRALRKPCAVRSRSGETLLHYAAWSDKSDDARRVLTVLALCPEVDVPDNDGVTALMKAARYGTAAAVRCLLAAGARAGMIDAQGLSAAEHAAAAGRWDLAEALAAGK